MENLEEIKHSVDSWYDFMWQEADKAVQEAFEAAAESPSQQENLPQLTRFDLVLRKA